MEAYSATTAIKSLQELEEGIRVSHSGAVLESSVGLLAQSER